MMPDRTPADVLLRMSLVEGFTARHLALLSKRRALLAEEPDGAGLAERTILQKGIDAACSREAGECADRVRATCARIGVRIVTLGSDGYPPLLSAVPDAPLALYVRGSLSAGGLAVGIVGCRAPTAAGREFTLGLSADLAFHGIVVVSGMARGIDTAAHEGALSAGGETAAVLGCGVDVLYPPEAGRLRKAILERGAIMSEFAPGTRPLPRRFPARNRIISGLARAVIVVEAPAKSGALITARFALEQGREVMAVPGSPVFPHTAGSNRLLQDGALMVTGAEDVWMALGHSSGAQSGSREWPGDGQDGGLEGRILRFLSVERHIGEIAGSLDVAVPELLPCLLDMELRKLLERRSGDYYKKMSKSGRTLRGGA